MPPPHVSFKDLFERMYSFFVTHQQLYEESSILGDITLRDLSLPETHFATDAGSATEGASSINYDTPLQTTAQFQSMRRLRYPDTPPTLQDHLETFYYIILYSTYMHTQHTGASSVTQILTYIRKNYTEGTCSVITRGSDGLSELIANEARVDFAVTGNRPLTEFLKDALIGIWAWYAHHQVIADGGNGFLSNRDEPLISAAARKLYLYDHKGMRSSFENALNGLRELEVESLTGGSETAPFNESVDFGMFNDQPHSMGVFSLPPFFSQ